MFFVAAPASVALAGSDAVDASAARVDVESVADAASAETPASVEAAVSASAELIASEVDAI